jgi:hypothetical protein
MTRFCLSFFTCAADEILEVIRTTCPSASTNFGGISL